MFCQVPTPSAVPCLPPLDPSAPSSACLAEIEAMAQAAPELVAHPARAGLHRGHLVVDPMIVTPAAAAGAAVAAHLTAPDLLHDVAAAAHTAAVALGAVLFLAVAAAAAALLLLADSWHATCT